MYLPLGDGKQLLRTLHNALQAKEIQLIFKISRIPPTTTQNFLAQHSHSQLNDQECQMHEDDNSKLSAKSSPAQTPVIPISQDFVRYFQVCLSPTPGLIYLYRHHGFRRGLRDLFSLGGLKKKKAMLQLLRVPWKRRKTDASSCSPKIHNDQCLSNILLCPSCDCLIRC